MKLKIVLLLVIAGLLAMPLSAMAAKQFGSATYYFDGYGNYNGTTVNYCNLSGVREETIPGVPKGPYYREDVVVCSPLGGGFITTGYDCYIAGPPSGGLYPWSCSPVGFNAAEAKGTQMNLPPSMTIEQSCNILSCDVWPFHDAWYVPVPGGGGLHIVN